MDILEAGMDRPERDPSRRRSLALALAAAALAIGGGAVWLHQPGTPAKPPSPVALSSTPAATPTTVPPNPSPTVTVYPFHADAVSHIALTCRQFLAGVAVLTEGEYGLHLTKDQRSATQRDVTYTARTGTVTVHAQCGPIVWGGPVGQHVGDANEDYIDLGARAGEPGGPRPSVAIFRADNADGWYEIQAGGPDGRLGDGATLPHLMATIAHTPLINWVPPGRAGDY